MKESIIHSLKEKFNDTFCCALCKIYNTVMAVLVKILNLITIEMRKLMQTEDSGKVHDIIDSFKKEIFNARFCKSLCDFWNKIRDFWNQNDIMEMSAKKSFLEMTPEKICVHIKSVLYALGLVLVVVVSNILAIFGNSVVGWIGSKFALPTAFLGALNLAIYIIPFVVLIIGLTLFYLFAPYSYTLPISDAFFAAFFVTVLWFVLTIFYRLALMLIPRMGMSYGPVFGLFIMFFWLQYIVAIIIVGLGLIQGNTSNFQNKLDAVRRKENENQ